MNPYPYVILCVVNTNEKEWLINCLPSLSATDYPNFKIIVIDNASTDGSAEFVRDNFSHIELIKNKRNIGFTRAVNMAINIALNRRAEYVMTLNPDIKFYPDWINELIKVAQKDKNIAILMPLHLNYSGDKVDLNLSKILDNNTQYLEDKESGNLKEVYEVGSAIGGLIRTQVINKIGYMDPIYFLGAEDSDLARRVIFHGYKIVVATKSKIMHWHRMLHKDKISKQMGFFIFRSQFIYFLKDPNRPFFSKLWQYYFNKNTGAWKIIKSWADINNLRYLAVAGYIQLWIFLHLPIIFIRQYRDRNRI